MWQERVTACTSACLSRASSDGRLASIQARKASSATAPYLMTSASPATSSRSGSDSRTSTSATTASGWWKAPIMFLPDAWFTPVLPPTEESTWASSVVGTCT